MRKICVATVLTTALAYAPAAFAGQDARSPDVVKQLTALMDQKKLDSVAAPDPQSPGTFVAALYFPGSQVLLVSAKYAAPSLLNEKIGKKDYREVYIDLSSASVTGTKVFVMDANADGLLVKAADDSAADSIERAGGQVSFDGAKKAKMSDADYAKAFSEADATYVHALQLLIAQLKGT